MTNQLRRNLVLNIVYNLLSIMVPFITAPYLGRVLGVAQVGTYTYIFSICSYFIMFGLLGISNYGTRTIAKVRGNRLNRSRLFIEVYTMQLISSGMMFLSYMLYIGIMQTDTFALNIIMSLYVFSSITDIGWYFQGVERFQNIVLRNAAIKLVNIVLIFAFVRTELDLTRYVAIMALSYFASPLLLWKYIIKDIDFSWPKWRNIKKHFRPNMLLFIPTLASSVYQIIDKIMIGFIASKSQLAYYEYADKIIYIPIVVLGSFGAVMLSRMSHIIQNEVKNTEKVIRLSMDFSMFISIGFAFGVAAISKKFVILYYGSAFQESGLILSLLAFTVPLLAWNNVIRMQYLIPMNFERVYITATLSAAIVNLFFNFLLIPRFLASGATVGTIAAHLVMAVIFYKGVSRLLPLKEMLFDNIFVIASGVIMFVLVKMVQMRSDFTLIGLIIDVSIGFFIYIFSLLVLSRTKSNHLIYDLRKTLWLKHFRRKGD